MSDVALDEFIERAEEVKETCERNGTDPVVCVTQMSSSYVIAALDRIRELETEVENLEYDVMSKDDN